MGTLTLQDRPAAGEQAHENSGINVHSVERAGSALLGSGLITFGLSRGSLSGWLLATLGGGLLYRGLTGHCSTYSLLGINTASEPEAEHSRSMNAEHSLVINREAEELFDTWRHFKGLPDFMSHLLSVEEIDERRSRWTAKGPLGTTIKWQAEITEERPNELIAWRSIEGADVETSGSVRFAPVGDGNATRVTVQFRYDPPAGAAGALLSQMLGANPERQMRHDLIQFKSIMENDRARAAVRGGSHGLTGPTRGGLGG